MKNSLGNNRGAEKIMSVYWFVILFLVAGGIYMMVNSFYGNPYDVREVEANLLSQKIADCISYGGKIDTKIFDGREFNLNFSEIFLEKCGLNFDVEDESSEGEYFISMEFFDLSLNKLFYFDFGNLNLKSSCVLQEEKDYDKLAYCDKSRFYSTKDNEQYLIEITSVIGKVKENVK
jgi:hypothetical protein